MRTMVRGKITLLFMTFGLLLAIPVVALADDIRDGLDTSAQLTQTITAGSSTGFTNQYWIVANSGGGSPSGCDVGTADDGKTATFQVNTPDGVTATPSTLTFDVCRDGSTLNSQQVRFTSNTSGTYTIPALTKTGGEGTYTTNNTTFKLVVQDDCPDGDLSGSRTDGTCAAPVTNHAPTVSTAAADVSGNEGDTLTANGAFSDADGDSLTITKQSGAGTVTLGTNGAWSWSHTPNDNGSGTVVVRATDPDGEYVEDSFDWSADNVNPVIGALNLTGANATACQASPGRSVGLSFSISDAGSADTHDGTIHWGDGQSDTFTGSSVNKSHSYVGAGTFTIRVEANDDDGGTDTRSATNGVNLRYQVSQLLSPVNPTGSHMSVFKHGSTVPLKVQITDCENTAVGGLTPSIRFTKINPATPVVGINEGISTSAANNDFQMRYDATNGQYIYNLGTKSLADGDATYQANVRDASIQNMDSQHFGLRTK